MVFVGLWCAFLVPISVSRLSLCKFNASSPQIISQIVHKHFTHIWLNIVSFGLFTPISFPIKFTRLKFMVFLWTWRCCPNSVTRHYSIWSLDCMYIYSQLRLLSDGIKGSFISSIFMFFIGKKLEARDCFCPVVLR